MELGRSNLEEFTATLLELARQDRDLLVLTLDNRGFCYYLALDLQGLDHLFEVRVSIYPFKANFIADL